MRCEAPIYNDKIMLRTLEKGDASQKYFDWLLDPAINRFLEVRFSPPKSVAELSEYIATSILSVDTLALGIFLRESERHIGNVKLGPIDWNHKVGAVGFILGDKEMWGKGYASMAISLVSKYAFENLGIAKLTAGCYSKNEGSRRALVKAGYKEEGRQLAQWEVDGLRQDGFLMGLVNPRISSAASSPTQT